MKQIERNDFEITNANDTCRYLIIMNCGAILQDSKKKNTHTHTHTNTHINPPKSKDVAKKSKKCHIMDFTIGNRENTGEKRRHGYLPAFSFTQAKF